MRKLFERFLPIKSPLHEKDRRGKVLVGIAAMDKKAKSKQMNQILQRLKAYGEFEIIIFGDETILHKPIEEWPLCDCLLSWHSDGFPLKKAQEYAKLRNPFCVNDLPQQHALLDRTQVYRTLVTHQIPVPKHIIVERNGLDPAQDPEGFVEMDDYVELNGMRINKPFVEKPEFAEDHNIWIYYPSSMGGGVKRLFRKVNDKSSHYDSQHSGAVRRDGNFIYEEFLTTGGTDVKVYTVGPRYAHAEARKSPVVDGKVLRTADGKEMRFPVLLTPQEKEVARQVVIAFNQNVCGFDLLRSEKGKSYVCDVNGWSFVKNSKRYYDDSAGILRSMILGAVAPQHLAAMPTPDITFASISTGVHKHTHSHTPLYGLEHDDAALLMDADEPNGGLEDELASCIDDAEIVRTDQRSESDELRCVLAVIRHGDRTPKQKLKLHVTAEPLLSLFHKYKDAKGKQAKLKSPGQLQELLNITRQLLQSMEKTQDEAPPQSRNLAANPQQALQNDSVGNQDVFAAAAAASGGPIAPVDGSADDATAELREKLRIVRTVLEQASFNGINRKVQIKPIKWRAVTPQPEQPAEGGEAEGVHKTEAGKEGGRAGSSSSGALQEKEGKDYKDHKEQPPQQLEEALLVCKWGGVLTHAGRQQAEDLGKVFRLVMYPRYGSAGGGLLRLHSTYRHDLKIYSSDEGRVQASAAAFAKGLLDLEGTSLTPILVSLVKKDASMLDAFGKGASEDIQRFKDAVYLAMTHDPEKGGVASNKGSTLPTPTQGSSPPAISRTNSTNLNSATGSTSQSEQQLSDKVDKAARIGGQTGDKPGHSSSPFSSSMQLPPKAADAARPAGPAIAGAGAGTGGTWPVSVRVPWRGEGPEHEDIGSGNDYSPMPPPPLAPPTQSPSIPNIKGMPDQPLALLRRLLELMKVLVGQLRELCLQEKMEPGPLTGNAGIGGRYSSLSHEPRTEWQLEPGKPCSGERMLLMFDRWRKLLKSFYSEKKGTFDISKVPDIYDSAKYDANHNDHLHLDLRELYIVSRQLATAVIPNEYGIDQQGKLRIGSRIASELLGKLLVDLDAMREESVSTLRQEEAEEKQRMKDLAQRPGPSPNMRTPLNARCRSSSSNQATPPNKHESTPGQTGSVSRMSMGSVLERPAAPLLTGATGAANANSNPAANSSSTQPKKDGISEIGSPSAAPAAVLHAASSGRQEGSEGSAWAAVALTVAEGAKARDGTEKQKAGTEEGRSAGSDEDQGGKKKMEKKEGEEDEEDDSDKEGQGFVKEGDSDEEVEVEETIHRLCPDYARETINSPLRHVRTRIYFTSESHIHSLVNVLRLCHLSRVQEQLSTQQTSAEPLSTGGSYDAAQHPGEPHFQDHKRQQLQEQAQQDQPGTPGCMGNPLLSPEACAMLDNLAELDYLTHVVFRMYENKAVPVLAPERFRVEILFSPGAVGDPFQVAAERSRAASLSTKISRELASSPEYGCAQGAVNAADTDGHSGSTLVSNYGKAPIAMKQEGCAAANDGAPSSVKEAGGSQEASDPASPPPDSALGGMSLGANGDGNRKAAAASGPGAEGEDKKGGGMKDSKHGASKESGEQGGGKEAAKEVGGKEAAREGEREEGEGMHSRGASLDVQPGGLHAQQQQRFEYVSVSKANSTSGSVKLKSKPSSVADESEGTAGSGPGRFAHFSNCSANGADEEGAKPPGLSPKVKSKAGSVMDDAQGAFKHGKGKNSSRVSSRRVSNSGAGEDSEGESTYGGKNRQAVQHCCRGPAWHVLPVAPRTVLHAGHKDGVVLEALEEALGPMAKVHKFAPSAYAAALHSRIHGHPSDKLQRPTTPSV